jgi:hypothetical protein
MGLQLPNLNEGFSIKKLLGEFVLLPLVFFKNFEMGILFFNKKSFFFRRNTYILRAFDIFNGLSISGCHTKDCPVRFKTAINST